MADEATDSGVIAPPSRGRVVSRFSRYSVLSLVTVPVGYTLLLLARNVWDVNAGLLNIGVGMVLTPPSFFLYRWLVWRGGGGRSLAAEMFSFWQTVMIGALASSATIAFADAVFEANGALIVLAGLTGQGIIFVARFLWLDKVTFSPSAAPRNRYRGVSVGARPSDPPQAPSIPAKNRSHR